MWVSASCCLYTQFWEGNATTLACFSDASMTNCLSSKLSPLTCVFVDGDIRLFVHFPWFSLTKFHIVNTRYTDRIFRMNAKITKLYESYIDFYSRGYSIVINIGSKAYCCVPCHPCSHLSRTRMSTGSERHCNLRMTWIGYNPWVWK